MADILDLEVDQGASWSREVEWQDESEAPIDVTGFSARMQIRRKVTSSEPLLSLSSPSDGITVGDTDGIFTIEVDADTTAALPASPTDHRWYYDFEVESPGGEVTRLLQGRFIVSPEVTR